jgi:hypothetical protein
MTDVDSGLLRLMTSALGAAYPARLSVGISFGTICKMAVAALAAAYVGQPLLHALDQFALYLYIVAITPLLFIPIMFGRKGAPDSAVRQVNTVRLLIAEAGFTRGQTQLIWRSLIEKYIKAAQVDLSRPPKVVDLYSETAKEFSGDGGHPS